MQEGTRAQSEHLARFGGDLRERLGSVQDEVTELTEKVSTASTDLRTVIMEKLMEAETAAAHGRALSLRDTTEVITRMRHAIDNSLKVFGEQQVRNFQPRITTACYWLTRPAIAMTRRQLVRPSSAVSEMKGGESRISSSVRRKTLEFAVTYLPTEGLFAEEYRTPGLIETLRRQHAVMVVGPSLLASLLHCIRMGHLTLRLQQKAGIIGEILAAVKAEWARLGKSLDALARRADTLSNGIKDT
ncbi:MAG: DNA recombination protein RmuC [Stellaceae bacterium]